MTPIALLLAAATTVIPSTPKPAAPAPKTAAAVTPKTVEEPRGPSTPQMYEAAIELHGRGRHAQAAAALYRWLAGAPRASEKYDLVQHLLAEDFAKLGLYHAAVAREAAVARSRARPELLPEALARLEQWTTAVPFEETRVFAELLHDTDFGTIDGPALGWVAYHQGESDLKAGNDRWAAIRFSQIPETSPYKARARLLDAAKHVGQDDSEVVGEFEALASDKSAPTDVRNDARIQAARLRYERGQFQEALAHYEAIDLPELDPGRGQLYLEQAWTLYRLGRGGRAMGLLAALDAPSFKSLFLPDKHLLRAFIFKDACQLLPAKQTARELNRRYRTSLDAIQQRRPLTEDPMLVGAALQKGGAVRIERFLVQLKRERDLLNELSGWFAPTGLAKHLSEFYAAAIGEMERQRQLELERGVEKAADDLLHAAEQVSLLDYEVGLALYRRDRGHVPASSLSFENVDARDGEVRYEFDGEYWNDELMDLRFALTNRCVEGVKP